MSTIIITNIKQLVNTREENKLLCGKEMSVLPCIENAYLVIENGIIAEIGNMEKLGWTDEKSETIIDASGQFVLPAWCDSHTHLVFAASRESEFIDKIKGMSYAEIAAKGGGILNSAKKLGEASELELNMAEPIIAFNLLFGLTLLRNAAVVLASRCIAGIQPNRERCLEYVRNSIGLVTALNPVLGYERRALGRRVSGSPPSNRCGQILQRPDGGVAPWLT